MGWRNRPTFLENWPKDIDYAIFIDENGDANLKNINKCINNNKDIDPNNIYFNITGCIVKRDDLFLIRNDVMGIKNKYWEQGKYLYRKNGNETHQRVCFHSSEIRGRKGAFSDKVINYNDFINDLSEVMKNLPVQLISMCIDKEKLCRRHGTNAWHPYCTGLTFMLERYVNFILEEGEKGIIILEGRGKKEDRTILDHIKNIMDEGTYYVPPYLFKDKLKGVYFNPKWQNGGQKSYFGLEIADLCAYPIYKYIRFGTKDPAFNAIENKFYYYPNYNGRGLKIFP